MLSAENLATIESEGARLLEFARRDPSRKIPQYPTWSMTDLVRHTASIHGRTILICTTLPQERIAAPVPPDGIDPIDWFESNLFDMVEVLRESDPRTPVWSFGSDSVIGFWERRMVVETGLHRWDAQQAFEAPDPLSEIVSAAGLDEFEEMWMPRMSPVPLLEVRPTDMGATWRFGSGEPQAVVAATASDVYLRLMSRPGAKLPPMWEAAVDALTTPAG